MRSLKKTYISDWLSESCHRFQKPYISQLQLYFFLVIFPIYFWFQNRFFWIFYYLVNEKTHSENHVKQLCNNCRRYDVRWVFVRTGNKTWQVLCRVKSSFSSNGGWIFSIRPRSFRRTNVGTQKRAYFWVYMIQAFAW